MPALDEREIMQLRADLLDVWQKAHAQWKVWEELYAAEHKIKVVEGLVPRKKATARAKVAAMVDTLVTNTPVVKRDPLREGQKHKESADKTEKWGGGVLQLAGKESLIPPGRLMAIYLVLLGYTVGGAKWRSAIWPSKPRKGANREAEEEYEARRKKAFPFLFEVPHPGRVLIPPSADRRATMVIESATVFARDAEAEFGEAVLGEIHAKPYDTLEQVTYWDEDVITVLLNERKVKTWENKWGVVPWVHAYAGAGMERSPTYGGGNARSMELGPKPEDMAIGLLAGIEDQIKADDELHTALLGLARRTANPPMFFQGDTLELADAYRDAGVGAVLELAPGQSPPEWEKPPQIGPWVFELQAQARKAIDEATFAVEVQGFRSPGVPTATQHALMLGSAKMKFVTPLMQLNHISGLLLGFCAKMVEAKKEQVTAGGVTCSKDDFEGNYEFIVNYEAKDEAALLRARDIGMREVQVGLLDKETYLEESGRADATGIQERIWVQRALELPVVQQPIVEAAVQEFARRRAEEGRVVTPAPVGPPGSVPAVAQAGPTPQPFVAQPGGPGEAAAVMRGMTETPGEEGMMRAGR